MSELNPAYEVECRERLLAALERPAVRVLLPSWVATVAGFSVIMVLCLFAIAIAQARQIDLLAARLSVLETELVEGEVRVEELGEETATARAVLDELQSWRVHVTLASRMSWAAASRYIRENPLPLPLEAAAWDVPGGGGQD